MTIDTVGTPSEEDRSGFWPNDERWYMCDYCGWWFPKSDTRIEQWSGLRACTAPPGDYGDESFHDDNLRNLGQQLIFSREEEQVE